MSFNEDIFAFLTNTLNKLEKIEDIIITQKEKIKILETKIEEYEILKEKLDMADKILEEAKNNANSIVHEALIKAERIEHERMILEKNMKIYKERIKNLLETQLRIAEDLDKIEL